MANREEVVYYLLNHIADSVRMICPSLVTEEELKQLEDISDKLTDITNNTLDRSYNVQSD